MALAVLVLVVEGYLGFQYYNQYYGSNAVSDNSSANASANASSSAAAEPEGTVASETTGPLPETPAEQTDQRDATALTHRATPENIVDNSTYIDHPLANGNPDAVLLATQVWGAEADVLSSSPIGVWYDTNRGGRWAIFNQDLAPMPQDANFSVVVVDSPEQAIVHRADPANTVDNVTYLDHPQANGEPGAVLSVTSNWNPGGADGIYSDHFIGTAYDADEERWAILNQDFAPIPQDATFNVLVSS